jgi:probable phosphoglycerate mutase
LLVLRIILRKVGGFGKRLKVTALSVTSISRKILFNFLKLINYSHFPANENLNPIMSLRLYLLRHGETIYSQTGQYCGELNPDLTPEGHQMAQAFATAYSHLEWKAVYCSPMKRTIATAKPLCEATGIEMQQRDALKEIRYGAWEGQDNDWVQQNYHDDYVNWLREPAWNPPTEGETAVEIASRASLVISEIRAQCSTGNILVVSHKATLRIILCSLLGIDLGRYRDRIGFLAASLSVMKLDQHGPLIETLGDRSYLDKHLRDRAGT